MATKIVTKNSSTASAVPTASDLVQGELAVNVADKRLFTEDNGGSIVELGTNPSTIDINAGTIDGTTIGASSASTGAFTTLTASGAVGIGTSSPATGYRLDISGSSGYDDVMRITGVGTNIGPRINLTPTGTGNSRINATANSLLLQTGGTERMRIDSSGNVGIGTTSPSEKLQVEGTVSATGMKIGANGTDINSTFLGASSLIAFKCNDTERLRIDSSGNLLVGTTDTTLFNNTSGGGFSVSSNGLTQIAKQGGDSADPVLMLNQTGLDGEILRFYKDGTSVGSIGTEGGRLQIGKGASGIYFYDSGPSVLPWNIGSNTSADNSIDLGSSGGRFKDLYLSGQAIAGDGSVTAPAFRGTDTNTGIYFPSAGVTAISRNGVEGCRMDASGNLLVGTTDPYPHDNTSGNGVAIGTSGVDVAIADGEALYLNRMGSDGRIVNFRKAGSFVSGIDVTSTTVTYNTSSDQRLKENIADADDAGSKIDAIQVRKFDWKADGSHQDYGMIAQELQTVAPEAVSGDADSEEMMGVDYSKLVPMLIKEIQSLRNRVAQLEE